MGYRLPPSSAPYSRAPRLLLRADRFIITLSAHYKSGAQTVPDYVYAGRSDGWLFRNLSIPKYRCVCVRVHIREVPWCFLLVDAKIVMGKMRREEVVIHWDARARGPATCILDCICVDVTALWAAREMFDVSLGGIIVMYL